MNKMLTGKFPQEAMYNGDLSRIIRRATAIDPENRYQNVQRLKMALKNCYSDRAASVEVEYFTHDQYGSDGALKRIIAHLPYPIRELPGFRSGKPLFFFAACGWYALLISLGFFAVAKNPEYSAAQNRFYDIATFLLFIVPTLYLGNYLGIRDRLPWMKSSRSGVDYLRIGIGAVASVVIVILIVTIAALILHM